MPRASIRVYISALVGLTLLPLLGFSLFLLFSIQSSERERLDRIVQREAATVGTRTAQQHRDMLLTLRLLGSAPELESGDFEGFHARAKAALANSAYFLIAVGEDGQQLLNTRVAFGTALGKTSEPRSLEQALRDGLPLVSDGFYGRVAQEKVFNVILPLPASAAPAAALILTQNAKALAGTLGVEPLFAEWDWGVVDGADEFVVVDGRGADLGAIGGVPESSGRSGVLTHEGYLIGYGSVPGSTWRAFVWGPVSSASTAGDSYWWLLALGGTVALVIAVLVGAIIGRRLQDDVTSLSAMARQMGDGEVVPPIRSSITEISRVSEAMSEASFDRSEAEEKLYVIGRELVHRTKNLLAVIQAVISQTARSTENVADFQADMTSRIAGLAQSVDLMTSHAHEGVSLTDLIRNQLAVFLPGQENVEISGEDFLVADEVVQTFGMVVHELATNSVKYGALSTPSGRILIEWAETENDDGEPMLRLSWIERGGPPPREPTKRGFGTSVITRNVEAVFHAAVEIEFPPTGFVWRMKGPMKMIRHSRRKKDAGAASSATLAH